MKKSTLHKIEQSLGMASVSFSPSEANAQKILDFIMPDLNPDELKKSLINYYKYKETGDKRYIIYFDPVPALFNAYGILQKHQKSFVKYGRKWWPYIQKYINNPNYVLLKISEKKPIIKTMLSTELGDDFIKYYTNRLATFLEFYFRNFPRYHLNCGGIIIYGLVNKVSNSWGFKCRRDNIPIALDDMESLTYMKRNYSEQEVKKHQRSA
jgi:hypothetical protein